MQPYPFVPWVWRDASWFTDRHPTGDDSTATGDRPDTGLIGYEVEATDGGIGKVDRSNAEVPADCLMVDTGPWIFGRRVVIPVGVVHRVDHEQRKVHVDRTKQQIKDAPEYEPGKHDSEDHRQRTGDYYTRSYRDFPLP